MAFLLLATVDSRGETLHEMLTAQGWWVTLVNDRHDAMRAAAAQEPRVVIVDALLPGARELVGTFSSRNGGPGSIVLGAPESQLENLALVEAGADELLSAYPRVEELSRAIDRVAESPQRGGVTEPILVGKRLSASEIFGDILREVDDEGAAGGRPAPAVESKLGPTSPVDEGLAAAAVEEGTGPGADSFDLEAPASVGEPWAEMTADRWPDVAPEPEATGEAFAVGEPSVEAADVSSSAGFGGEATVEEGPTSAVVGEGTGPGVDSFDLEGPAPVEEPWAEMTADRWPDVAPEPEAAGGAFAVGEPSAEAVDALPIEELEVEPVSPLSFDELDEPEGDGVESRTEEVESDEPSVAAVGEDGRREMGERAEAEYGTGTGLSEASDLGPLGGSLTDTGPAEIPEAAEPTAAAASSGIAGDSSGLGQYQLEERIAVGGMAEVWRASMVGLEGFRKAVAIKKILPHLAENEEFVRMFVDEAKLAAQLSHENLVDIYDLGKMGKDFFIAMELVEGHDLRSILDRLARREERFPIDLALYIGVKLAAALDYAHGHCDEDGLPLNLVHRDVSPRNVLISHGGNVRLCDFGVAKAVSSVPRTEIGALKGKLHYMSPEQAAGASVDSRSDLFSLGSVLYEMITGRRPFLGDSEISLLEAVRRGKVEDPRRLRSDLPQDVAFIVKTALEKSPGKRWGSAGELQLELEEALYRLGAKPSPGTLANWLAEIYREDPPPVLNVEAETADAVTAEAAKVEAASEEERAKTVQVIIPGRQVAGGQRFWFGVLAGFLLAAVGGLAAALLLGYL